VVSSGWRQGGEMTQALYAHMNNKKKKEEDKHFINVNYYWVVKRSKWNEWYFLIA
jgi:hypothetical protein